MNVVLLSDTHGAVDDGVLDIAQRADLVVHAGDIGCAAVLEALKPVSGKVLAVTGNNDIPDKWPPRDHALLATLPEQLSVDLPGGVLSVEHGHRVYDAQRYHPLLRRRHGDARAILYGHTHVRVVDTAMRPWVLNPGAAGRVRTKGGASCLVLKARKHRWSVAVHCPNSSS